MTLKIQDLFNVVWNDIVRSGCSTLDTRYDCSVSPGIVYAGC